MISKKLTINSINDDMLKFVVGKGYKLPCVSIKQHYGKSAEFIINFENDNIINYEMNVFRDKLIDNKVNNIADYIYLIPA